jgi:hypothetical protein
MPCLVASSAGTRQEADIRVLRDAVHVTADPSLVLLEADADLHGEVRTDDFLSRGPPRSARR